MYTYLCICTVNVHACTNISCTSTDEGDYTALTRAVTLTPTVTQQCVLVMIEDDSVLEETESLTVSLSLTGAPDSVQLSEQTATIVITNDDGKGFICILTFVHVQEDCLYMHVAVYSVCLRVCVLCECAVLPST